MKENSLEGSQCMKRPSWEFSCGFLEDGEVGSVIHRGDSGQLGLELDLSFINSMWPWASYEISPEPQFLLMENGEGWERGGSSHRGLPALRHFIRDFDLPPWLLCLWDQKTPSLIVGLSLAALPAQQMSVPKLSVPKSCPWSSFALGFAGRLSSAGSHLGRRPRR